MAVISTHEDLSRKHTARGPSDRNFGMVFAVFFLLVGVAPLRRHLPVRWWALAVSLVSLIVAIAKPAVLRQLNKAWMQLGHLLGKVMTPVVTGLLFFLVFSPAGFLTRLLGRDSLRLSFDKKAVSYWIERNPPGPPPEEMSNQF